MSLIGHLQAYLFLIGLLPHHWTEIAHLLVYHRQAVDGHPEIHLVQILSLFAGHPLVSHPVIL